MENKAHYALIGTFVILAILASITFATWLSGRQFDQEFDEITVEFSGPVRGLTKGSEVRLNGLSVGEVSSLKFDPKDPNLILVTLQVIDGTPVYDDGFAQLEPQGLTGLNYVQINPGTSTLPLDIKNKTLPGRMSQFDNFLVGGENIIDGATSTINRINYLLSEDAINDIHGILDNVNQLTDNLKDADVNPELVDAALAALEDAGQSVASAARAIENSAEKFDQFIANDVAPAFEGATETMAKIGPTIDRYASLAENSTLAAQDLRDAINRLSNSGLADLEETTDALRSLMISLANIADQLERSPAQFIAGEEREVMELPQ